MGEYSHSLDAKGRIILPAVFREVLGEKFIITKGFENCLFVYPYDEWERVSEKINALPSNKASARRIQRTFIPAARECEPDKNGRVLVPINLREYADITKDVAILGNGNKIEIWDSGKWNSYMQLEAESMTIEEAAEDLDDISF